MKLGLKSRIIIVYLLMLLSFLTSLWLYHREVISLTAAVILVLIITSILTYLTVSRLINPLQEITSVSYQMAGGILENEIIIDADTEYDELASSINVMAKQLRQQMTKMNETRYLARAILDSMADGVIALDSKGKLLMINPALEKIFNLEKDKAIGKKLIEVIRNYELDQLLRQVLANKQPAFQEIKMLLPEPKIFRVNATPLKSTGGSSVGVVALMRDVTRYQQLEKMRRDFVANVSHELRTPLTSIKGFLETLLDGAIEDENTAKHFLNIMKLETDRLTKLIDDLLKLSKLENRKTIFNKKPVDLNEIIDQVIFIFKPQAEAKDIYLKKIFDADIPTVPAERDLLIQVLINLVDNAIKYTPSGGQVVISTKADDGQINVSVEDTGPGIPKESLARIFERFYRVDKARAREAGGTGLGLAIVKHVIELHDGSIKVENTKQGAKFTFSLPYGNDE